MFSIASLACLRMERCEFEVMRSFVMQQVACDMVVLCVGTPSIGEKKVTIVIARSFSMQVATTADACLASCPVVVSSSRTWCFRKVKLAEGTVELYFSLPRPADRRSLALFKSLLMSPMLQCLYKYRQIRDMRITLERRRFFMTSQPWTDRHFS